MINILSEGLIADHPRSRGVYWFDQQLCEAIIGSSPLARGLLVVALIGGGVVRIIPARAGFTGPDHGGG